MAPITQSKICLDVAVDHRIRRLFKPVPDKFNVDNPKESSGHVSRLKARGYVLRRSEAEIEVTAKLAHPAVKGGIAIALQQPRENHPFEKGLNAVISDCNTLFALFEIFQAVSCKTIDIRTDVTIIDLLPYMAEKALQMDDKTLRDSFQVSAQSIWDKEPQVLLCAGRIWLPKKGRVDTRKGDAFRFETLGVGEKFGSRVRYPVKTQRIREEGGRVTINRVNGFHPSHAMNYNPHVSLLRQLLILTGAETCGMLRDDWNNKEWMDDLRERCKYMTESLSGSPSKSPPPASPSSSSSNRGKTKYIPEYQELYTDALLEIKKAIQLILKSELANLPSKDFYEILLSSRLSEICNDASLILRQMFHLERRGWPASVAWKNEAALADTEAETLDFAKALLEFTKQGNDTKFAKIIRETSKRILKRVKDEGTGYKFDLSEICNDFLLLAVEVETLLLDLLEDLSTMMGSLTLGTL